MRAPASAGPRGAGRGGGGLPGAQSAARPEGVRTPRRGAGQRAGMPLPHAVGSGSEPRRSGAGAAQSQEQRLSSRELCEESLGAPGSRSLPVPARAPRCPRSGAWAPSLPPPPSCSTSKCAWGFRGRPTPTQGVVMPAASSSPLHPAHEEWGLGCGQVGGGRGGCQGSGSARCPSGREGGRGHGLLPQDGWGSVELACLGSLTQIPGEPHLLGD